MAPWIFSTYVDAKRMGTLLLPNVMMRVIAIIAAIATVSLSSAVPSSGADLTKSESSSSAQKSSRRQVILYYFHGNNRCHTCIQIEQWIRETVKEEFVRETQKGDLLFQVLNYEQAPNTHFLKKYNLTCPAAILTENIGRKENRWVNLSGIWDYAGDPIEFRQYITGSIRKYFETKSDKSNETGKTNLEAQ